MIIRNALAPFLRYFASKSLPPTDVDYNRLQALDHDLQQVHAGQVTLGDFLRRHGFISKQDIITVRGPSGEQTS